MNPNPSPAGAPRPRLAEGFAALRENRIDAAAALRDQWLATHRDDPEVRFYAAEVGAFTGELEDALGHIEAAIQQTYWQAAVFFATGESAKPLGSAHTLTAPYQAFACADGFLNIGGANQANWERIADALGHPEWRQDPRFVTNTDRMTHREELTAEIERVTRQKSVAHWQAIFDAAGVPAGPVHSVEQALTHEQTLARHMVVTSEHPKAGPVRGVGNPIKFSSHPSDPTSAPAPMLGQHAFEVLSEFGYSEEAVRTLIEVGAVGSPVSV